MVGWFLEFFLMCFLGWFWCVFFGGVVWVVLGRVLGVLVCIFIVYFRECFWCGNLGLTRGFGGCGGGFGVILWDIEKCACVCT